MEERLDDAINVLRGQIAVTACVLFCDWTVFFMYIYFFLKINNHGHYLANINFWHTC